MSLKEYELFHGSVLTKLVRGDNPVTLRLIETDKLAWSVYKINDAVDVFIKYSSNPGSLEKGGCSWYFSFSELQLSQIHKDTHLALVCGDKKIKSKIMEICFIENDNVSKLLSNGAKVITVRLEPSQYFRVSSGAIKEKITIPRNAIEKYKIPS